MRARRAAKALALAAGLLLGAGLSAEAATDITAFAYHVPEPGDVAIIGLVTSFNCAELGPKTFACSGRVSAKGQLAGWVRGNGNSVVQIDNRLNLGWKVRRSGTSGSILAYTDYCQGASAGLSSCTRHLRGNSFAWTATKASGYPGVTICVDLTGSAKYKVKDGSSNRTRTDLVLASTTKCILVGGNGETVASNPR